MTVLIGAYKQKCVLIKINMSLHNHMDYHTFDAKVQHFLLNV